MGDMEDHEAAMCARDAQIDQYDDWLNLYPHADEPRVTLLSWNQFKVACWRCGELELVTRRGEHTYGLACDHIADRDIIDSEVRRDEQLADLYDYGWPERKMDCPTHLVKVTVLMSHGSSHGWDPLAYELGCGCVVDESPMRLACYHCDLIDGVAVPHRKVTGYGGIVEQHRDPTQTYKLECGHVMF